MFFFIFAHVRFTLFSASAAFILPADMISHTEKHSSELVFSRFLVHMFLSSLKIL